MEKKCTLDGNRLVLITIADFHNRPQAAYICKKCGRVFDYYVEDLLGIVPETWAIQKIIKTGMARLVMENGYQLVRPIEKRKNIETLADFLAECIAAWVKPKIEKGEEGTVIVMRVNTKEKKLC